MTSWFTGRFLGPLTLLPMPGTDPGPGYAVSTRDGRIWRNGEHVGYCTRLKFDRDALGWWVEYRSWRGSWLDSPAVTTPYDHGDEQPPDGLDVEVDGLDQVVEPDLDDLVDEQREAQTAEMDVPREQGYRGDPGPMTKPDDPGDLPI